MVQMNRNGTGDGDTIADIAVKIFGTIIAYKKKVYFSLDFFIF